MCTLHCVGTREVELDGYRYVCGFGFAANSEHKICLLYCQCMFQCYGPTHLDYEDNANDSILF